MADKAGGSVVLAQMQVSFLLESDIQGFSQFGWPFSVLKIALVGHTCSKYHDF